MTYRYIFDFRYWFQHNLLLFTIPSSDYSSEEKIITDDGLLIIDISNKTIVSISYNSKRLVLFLMVSQISFSYNLNNVCSIKILKNLFNNVEVTYLEIRVIPIGLSYNKSYI